jgi:ADP-ribose diphosphatase
MYSIIIADNLTNDYCSPEPQHLEFSLNIGVDEITRLFGSDEQHGNGVLPTFLHTAADAASEGIEVGLILLRDYHTKADPDYEEEVLRYGEHCLAGTKGAEFVKSVSVLEAKSEVVNSPNLAMPLDGFANAFEHITGINPLSGERSDWSDIRILLTGFHTEKRLLNTAYILRHVLGFQHVAITPHLTGSSNKDAHFTAMRYHYPDALIRVLPELSEAAAFVGLDSPALRELPHHACTIRPEEIRNEFTADQRMIVEVLCMHWTDAELKPLKGGFSGSFLFLANGWKEDARTEPMVMKIDSFSAIRKELKGYERVKDLLGKHVPSFSSPVSFGEFTGIGMELATMEGRPTTLQDHFEAATDDNKLDEFLSFLTRSLSLLSKNMYKNTLRKKHLAPYRLFGLHIDKQAKYLAGNLQSISNQSIGQTSIDTEMVQKMFDLVRKNDDGYASEMCLSHGDLNLANVICDSIGNIWAIDWTYTDNHPLEMDFTKLENDIKFVISKDFEPDDFAKLDRLEAYLLAQPVPAPLTEIPANLRFVAWDIRFKRMYLSVQIIREAFFDIKGSDDWLFYRIALLKYAIHTLSFDKSRGRGECGPIQLWYALASVDSLLFDLVGDDFQLKIRGERPDSYPVRFRISIDESNWKIPAAEYSPPYHVDDTVLRNERSKVTRGWADPEDTWQHENAESTQDSFPRDSDGKPLNPRGRTGIAGRGLLGRWGPNPVVLPLLTRINSETNQVEVLLVETNDGLLSFQQNFINFDEQTEEVVETYLDRTTGISLNPQGASVLHEGYLYDARQTDNAWIHATSYLFHLDEDVLSEPPALDGGTALHWKTMTPELVNQFTASHASILRNAMQSLFEQGIIDESTASFILKQTG